MNNKDEVMVYWEKQGNDRMCALHCLNSLFQGPYIDELFLSNIAHEIDELESRLLSHESTLNKNKDKKISQNVSDDGFFSIMVLQECLQRMGYSCLPAANPRVQDYIFYPTSSCGYIVNSSEHWLTIRCVKGKWYNLDSLKFCPAILDYFDVSKLLQDYIFSGKSVFIVQKILNEAESKSIPLPDPDPFIRPIKEMDKQKYYLSYLDIKRLFANQQVEEEKQVKLAQMSDESSPKNFLYSKRSTEHIWPTTGGNILKPTMDSDGIIEDFNEEDQDLEKAIKESAIEFATNIKLPEEPSVDEENVIQIRIRTKSGNSLIRRFKKENSCKYLFLWIEYEMALKGTPIQKKEYSLISQYPYLKLSKLDENSVQISRSRSDETVSDFPNFNTIGIIENSLLLLDL